MFGIWCEVSGGVTGYRCAWLKQDDAVAHFRTLEDAQRQARYLTAKAMANAHRKADFSYTAREMTADA